MGVQIDGKEEDVIKQLIQMEQRDQELGKSNVIPGDSGSVLGSQ